MDKKTRALILKCFTEGLGVNATARMADVSKNTVLKLLSDLAPVCREYQRRTLVNLKCKKIQCDEIWGFTGKKQKNVPEKCKAWGVGDTWSWIAVCAECRLVPSWLVAPRNSQAAHVFIGDLASRLAHRIQLSTDGFRPYLEAVESAWGSGIDYAMLIKVFNLPKEEARTPERKYSPAECCGTHTEVISGSPDPRHIATSYSERLNLEIRTKNRRLTRLTNGFSRKVANLEHSMDIGFMVYNFVRVHGTLKVSPAMEEGVTDHLWSYEEVGDLLEAKESGAVAAGALKRGPYRPRIQTEP